MKKIHGGGVYEKSLKFVLKNERNFVYIKNVT